MTRAIEHCGVLGSFGLIHYRDVGRHEADIRAMVDARMDPREVAGWIERKSYGRILQNFLAPNTRTTLGFDKMSSLMGGGTGTDVGPTGVTTSIGATTLTDSGLSMATDAFKGRRLVVVGSSALVYTTVKSNTGTVFTHDGCKTWGTGATAATPANGSAYGVGRAEPGLYIGVSTDSSADSAAHTAFTSEVSSNGITRTLAVYAHTAGTSTATLTATMTATGTVNSLQKAFLSDCLSGGILVSEHLWTDLFPVTNVGNGDVITPYWAYTFS